MRIAVAVLVAILLSSCGHFYRMGHAGTVASAHRAGSAVSGGGEVDRSAYLSESQALSYARGEMQKLAPQVEFMLAGVGNVYERALDLAETLLRDGVAVSFAVTSRGNHVTLKPTYADNELMFRAYQEPARRAALTPDQRRALSIAEDVVKAAQRNSSSQYECALALHDYLVGKSTYVTELHGKDSANATTRVLLTGKGVCDAYTRAYRLMLSIAGIENIFVAGVAQNDNHCWNLARLDGHWVHVDCTYSDPSPDEPGRVYRTHFALTDKLLARDHSWKRSNYPAADSVALYYPFRYTAFETLEDLVYWCRSSRKFADGQYVTAYVVELQKLGRNNEAVLQRMGQVHHQLGEHIIVNFALEEHLNGVIVCKCKAPATVLR